MSKAEFVLELLKPVMPLVFSAVHRVDGELHKEAGTIAAFVNAFCAGLDAKTGELIDQGKSR